VSPQPASWYALCQVRQTVDAVGAVTGVRNLAQFVPVSEPLGDTHTFATMEAVAIEAVPQLGETIPATTHTKMATSPMKRIFTIRSLSDRSLLDHPLLDRSLHD
jgi:hypothetical protein